MDFSVEFYTSDSGACPVLEFLEALKGSDPGDHAALLAGLAKLRNRAYHRDPLSKAIGDQLFELRHVGKLNSRVLYFFVRGRRLIVVHAIRNKARKISPQDRNVALNRMNNWLRRNGR